MFGLFIGLGPIARDFSAEFLAETWPSQGNSGLFKPCKDIAIGLFTPQNQPLDDFRANSGNNRIELFCAGFVITDSPQSGPKSHLIEAANHINIRDFRAGIQAVTGGVYALAAIDTAAESCSVYTDPVGTVPVYYAKIGESLLISTNPVALCRSGYFSPAIDETAFAEWALFSYAIGNRYPIKAIRTLRPSSYIYWNGRSNNILQYNRMADLGPFEASPAVEEIFEEFKGSCVRLKKFDPCPAQLQSAGYDSRLITAAWPKEGKLHCYTYGNPNTHEITIARQVSELRGAAWSHTWQHGDQVARSLESMFDDTGIIIWPDHVFAADQMAQDGFRGTLNGLGGDPLIGDTFLSYNQYLGKNLRVKRLLRQFYDLDYTDIGLDAVALAMYENMLQIEGPHELAANISPDIVEIIDRAKPDIIADIRQELEVVKPPVSSLALLWRYFLYANRIPNMISQQMRMLNKHVLVYCPISNDVRFHELAFRLNPREVAYYRLYHRLYKRCLSEYAAIPHGGTLIPISRPLWNHKLAAMLLGRNIRIPVLTNSASGKPRDPNSWALWLKESSKLRDTVASGLVNGGLADTDRAAKYFSDISSGRQLGSGKLFHMLSLAKWKSISFAAHKRSLYSN